MVKAAGSFVPLALETGLLVDLTGDPFPGRVEGLRGRDELELDADGTAFGFVLGGTVSLEWTGREIPMSAGQYFAVPGGGRLRGGSEDVRCLVTVRPGYLGFFHLGGPIEERGRLRYIDGCTDSLLIPPVVWGDPCLNLLHIPRATRQSRHTHPSYRTGIIVSGRGTCVTPGGDFGLEPGLPFLIPAGGMHAFHTGDADLRVIAFHPDSDFGPTHEDHPMVNRTILPTHEMS